MAIIVIIAAGFNFATFAAGNGHIDDQSLANTLLKYHVAQNPRLYTKTTATKTLVVEQGNSLVPTALASENLEVPPPAVPAQDQNLQNDNTLVAQNPDSVSELLKRQIKVYKTQKGDTIGSIARQYGVSIDTIKWANNLKDNHIDPDWELAIPPTDGLIIIAGPNTTLPDIVKKYKGNMSEILSYNGLVDEQDVQPGDYIFCKGCVIPAPPKPVAKPSNKKQIGIADDSIPNVYGGHTFPKGYCTYYVARKVKITFGGNAKNWLANAKAAGYETGSAPHPGSVVVTSENKRYGHVAYVKQVTEDSIVIEEMNFAGWNKISTRTLSLNNPVIRGYIYPKK